MIYFHGALALLLTVFFIFQVANFNESEQLIAACRVEPSTGIIIDRSSGIAGGGWASFVQIRGSVPLYWEQNATLAINPTPQLTAELNRAWYPFALHQVRA